MNKNVIYKTQGLGKVLKIVTPLLLATTYCLYKIFMAAINIQESEGWSIFELTIYLQTMLILATLDFIIRFVFKRKIFQIWVIEIILLIIGIWYFLNFIIKL